MMVTVLVMRGKSEKGRKENTFLPSMTCIHDVLVLSSPIKLVSLVQLLLVALTELQLLSIVGQVIVHGGVHVVSLLSLAVTQLSKRPVRIVQRVQP